MTSTAHTIETRSSSVGEWVEKINGQWHERALWIYMTIVVLHWIEHLLQAYQIWVIGMPRPEALGALGLVFPWLVRSELMHFGYAVVMLVGLIVLRHGFSGTSRTWWNVSLGIQSWHFVEHAALQIQAALGATMFGSPVPTSFLQVWVARPELHLAYNALVFIPMVIAMVYHLRKPQGATCSCVS